MPIQTTSKIIPNDRSTAVGDHLQKLIEKERHAAAETKLYYNDKI